MTCSYAINMLTLKSRANIYQSLSNVVLIGQIVEVIAILKYLGDVNLDYRAHITKPIKNITSVSGVLSKFKHLPPKSALKKIDFELVT